MCLILFRTEDHPVYRLIIAANRDEFTDRPAQAMEYWKDGSGILAGRDLLGGGTWLGVTQQGRFAAITNYRDPASIRPNAPSRGGLVTDYLRGAEPPDRYLQSVSRKGNRYNGFNLLCGDGSGLHYYSNRGAVPQKVAPGLHGLSNRLLDTPWPKVERGKKLLRQLTSGNGRVDPNRLLDMLEDRTTPPDADLPDTGVGLAAERMLSPMFIVSEGYGSRCSTVVMLDRGGRMELTERTYDHQRKRTAEACTRHYAFRVR